MQFRSSGSSNLLTDKKYSIDAIMTHFMCLHSRVLCVFACFRAFVLLCFACSHVVCSRAWCGCVVACLTFLRALRPYMFVVLKCFTCLRARKLGVLFTLICCTFQWLNSEDSYIKIHVCLSTLNIFLFTF